MLGLVFLFLFVLSSIMVRIARTPVAWSQLSRLQIGLAWFFGARFDVIGDDLRKREFLSRFNKPEGKVGRDEL